MMEDIIALKNINVETATDNNDEKSEKDKTKQNDEVTVEKKSFLSIEVHSKDDLTNVDEVQYFEKIMCSKPVPKVFYYV